MTRLSLQLKKETLRELTAADLKKAEGGVGSTDACPSALHTECVLRCLPPLGN